MALPGTLPENRRAGDAGLAGSALPDGTARLLLVIEGTYER
jgi:hypothetical protein